jgi:D-glycero-D-manno-heptose 1,7-bisphosphate phosphatase
MKVAFLDRDGVINEFPGNGLYVTRVKDFHFLPRTLKAVKLLSDAGYHIFVISNQAGVGKGVFSKDKLNRITARMLAGVDAVGARIDKVFYCTCRSSDGCHCRKPRIGNILKALNSIDKTIHEAQSAFFVGDTEGDIKAGRNAGCKTIFVLSGRENRKHMNRWDVSPDHIAEDLYDAVQIILEQDPHPARDGGRGASQGRRSRLQRA